MMSITCRALSSGAVRQAPRRHATCMHLGTGSWGILLRWSTRGVQGALYRRKAAGTHGKGAVALVLGAGNQTPVSALDVLHKLVLDDSVVICKMNPVNEWLGPFLRCVLVFAACVYRLKACRA